MERRPASVPSGARWRAPLAAALVALAAACSAPESPRAMRAGDPFPRMSLPLLGRAGDVVAIPEAGDGPLIVNVWATWCAPCRREMQSLEALHRRVSREGVRVVGVSVDEDPHLATEFVLSQRLTFANAIDARARFLRGDLALRSFPTTFVVNANGVVVWMEEGARDWSDAKTAARLAELLGGRS